MYNKKYIIKKIDEFNAHNSLYDDVIGWVCYPAYLKVGERGWLLCDTGNPYDVPHRMHTSTVESVECTDDGLIIRTQNTQMTLELIDTDGPVHG